MARFKNQWACASSKCKPQCRFPFKVSGLRNTRQLWICWRSDADILISRKWSAYIQQLIAAHDSDPTQCANQLYCCHVLKRDFLPLFGKQEQLRYWQGKWFKGNKMRFVYGPWFLPFRCTKEARNPPLLCGQIACVCIIEDLNNQPGSLITLKWRT